MICLLFFHGGSSARFSVLVGFPLSFETMRNIRRISPCQIFVWYLCALEYSFPCSSILHFCFFHGGSSARIFGTVGFPSSFDWSSLKTKSFYWSLIFLFSNYIGLHGWRLHSLFADRSFSNLQWLRVQLLKHALVVAPTLLTC